MLEIKIEKTREYGRQKVQTPIDRRKMLVATSRITECKTRVPKPISHYQDIFLVSSHRNPRLQESHYYPWSSQSVDTHSLFSLSLSLFYFVEWKSKIEDAIEISIYSLCTIKFILCLKIWSKVYANYNEFLEKIFFKRFFW